MDREDRRVSAGEREQTRVVVLVDVHDLGLPSHGALAVSRATLGSRRRDLNRPGTTNKRMPSRRRASSTSSRSAADPRTPERVSGRGVQRRDRESSQRPRLLRPILEQRSRRRSGCAYDHEPWSSAGVLGQPRRSARAVGTLDRPWMAYIPIAGAHRKAAWDHEPEHRT